MASKMKMRLLGLSCVLVGGGLTVNGWYVAHTYGDIWKPGAIIFPMILFVGLMALLVPVDKEALKARYGVEVPQTMEHYTGAQKAIVFGGAALSVVNYIALYAMAHDWI